MAAARTLVAAGVALLVLGGTARAAVDTAAIDRQVQAILRDTGVPSASVALVQGGALVYRQAYGQARLEPRIPARPQLRYAIGSISKQFTAAALLMLAEEGKLSLEDPVGRYLPALGHGQEVTVRQLLGQTSGYPDYWPQDYVPDAMLRPSTPQAILDRWTHTLDFRPNQRWEYSNTNYVAAGAIAEKLLGRPLFGYLRERIFIPLDMTSVADVDDGPLPPEDPQGYLRYGVGPLRPAPKEGKGWLFAMGELAMTAGDLARWDLSLLQRRLMKAESYRQMMTGTTLASGEVTPYGLGLQLGQEEDHFALSHGGEVSGFTAGNVVFPEAQDALVVLTNEDDSGPAMRRIEKVLAQALFDPGRSAQTRRARRILEELQHGRIDAALLSPNARRYFSRQALADFASSLGPLGPVETFKQTDWGQRGGMTERSFQAKFRDKDLRIVTYSWPDGKLEQYLVAPL